MTGLRHRLDDYLALRRSLGYQLRFQERDLRTFIAFAEQHDAETITTALAVTWATLPAAAQPIRWDHRLVAVRGFARYLAALDPATEVPPRDVLSTPPQVRPTPYIYAEDEVADLMAAARTLSPPVWAATVETMIGLLAVTGMRISEICGLGRDDVDLRERRMVVRGSKFGKSRELVCHHSTVRELRSYARVRDRAFRRPGSAAFFLTKDGTRVTPLRLRGEFRPLCERVGLRTPAGRLPRVHDLRHSLAGKRCCAGISTATTSPPGCRCCRPTSVTSTPATRTGTSQRCRS